MHLNREKEKFSKVEGNKSQLMDVIELKEQRKRRSGGGMWEPLKCSVLDFYIISTGIIEQTVELRERERRAILRWK